MSFFIAKISLLLSTLVLLCLLFSIYFSADRKKSSAKPTWEMLIWFLLQKMGICFLQWNSHISGHLSSVLGSHHFTFLWGPPFMLPFNWLSSCPYGKMYSVIVQCNSCTFYSFFVWLMIWSKSKPKIYLERWLHPL